MIYINCKKNSNCTNYFFTYCFFKLFKEAIDISTYNYYKLKCINSNINLHTQIYKIIYILIIMIKHG
jgi:hypothetical protein